MIELQGTEIFEIQKRVYEHLKGLFGLSEKNITVIAVALDAAAIFGALMERNKRGGFYSSDEELLKQLHEKMSRLGAKV